MRQLEEPLDDDMAGTPALAEQPSPHRLMMQFDACRREFDSAGGEALRSRDVARELLALGGIRQLYWLLCADGCASEAALVATWWEQTAPFTASAKPSELREITT